MSALFCCAGCRRRRDRRVSTTGEGGGGVGGQDIAPLANSPPLSGAPVPGPALGKPQHLIALAAASPQYDSFILETTGPPWTINTSSEAWNYITAQPSVGWTTVSGTGTTLTVQVDQLWTLQFSNSANADAFGDTSPVAVDHIHSVTADPNDTTVISHQVNGGVLGLVTGQDPTVPPSPLDEAIAFADVRTMFGIPRDDANSPLLSAFLNIIEAPEFTLVLNKTPGTRNALWAVPGETYRIVVGLKFAFTNDSFIDPLQDFINETFGLKLQLVRLDGISPEAKFTRIWGATPNGTGFVASNSFRMEVKLDVATFKVSVIFAPEGMSIMLADKTSGTGPIYQRLTNEVITPSASAPVQADSLPSPNGTTEFDQKLSGIVLRYVQIGMAGQSGGPTPPTQGQVFFQIGIQAGFAVAGQDCIALLTFDSRTVTFDGRLLFKNDLPPQSDPRQHDFETWTAISQNITDNLAEEVDIASLFGGATGPPWLPTKIRKALVSYAREQGGSGYKLYLSVEAKSTSADPAPVSHVPAGFEWTSIQLDLHIQDTDAGPMTTQIQFRSTFNLGENASGTGPATLVLRLDFMSEQYFLLSAEANDVPIAQLTRSFDSSSQHALKALGTLTLKNLNMLYTYTSSGAASSFLITAVVTLGGLELNLYYQYNSPAIDAGSQNKSAASIAWGNNTPPHVTKLSDHPSAPEWRLEAFVGASSPGATIQSIVESIAPRVGVLPDFVGKIAVQPAAGGDAPVKLVMSKSDDINNPDTIVLVVQVVLGDVNLTFGSVWGQTEESRFIFRVAVDKIPLIDSIPLVDRLPQPFDALQYAWVGSDTGGLTTPDVEMLNEQLGDAATHQFIFKKNNQPDPLQIVLQDGHHFMILNDDEVVVDHVFQTGNGTPSAIAADATGSNAVVALAETGSESAPTKGKLDKQLPFLSITGVTVQFRDLALYLVFDATMVLGPVTGTLIGFEIGLHLDSIRLNKFNLEEMLGLNALSFGISGLGVSVVQDPLVIAGGFFHDKVQSESSNVERYAGGVSVGFTTWKLTAVGAYQVVQDRNNSQKEYKSIFIYAKLNGPLFSIAFATVSGVRMGLGYNSIVRSPSMPEIAEFPFLDSRTDGDVGNDPIKLLVKMMGDGETGAWVTPKQDSYWVAAGLTITAFGILSITAVLMLGFHSGGVVISVFADAVASMPPDADPDVTLFYVQVYMLAELNTVEGYFTVQASLAPASHVLVPSCRLTGGFALFNWFDPSPHSGDFVFTVGGYHPAYKPPAWYPVPARVGVSFTLESMIQVTGNCYFAITPKCVMGGGALHMSLEVGPVSAWLDVALDVFIQFKPFHYTADMRVSVGCAITIKVWFVHVRIKASVGAALHIEGPEPFGGYANVDFYLFSFTVHFGSEPARPPPAVLPEFYDMVLTPGPAPKNEASAVSDPNLVYALKFLLTQGNYPRAALPQQSSGSFPDNGANARWDTMAGTFGCAIDVDFALTRAIILIDASGTVGQELMPLGSAEVPAFYSRPMHISAPLDPSAPRPFTSILSITVRWFKPDGTVEIIKGFKGHMVTKDVPAALWGSYSAAEDPAQTKNPTALKDPSGPTARLAMGVELSPPIPAAIPAKVQPFDPSIAFVWPLGPKPVPTPPPEQDKYLASEEIIPAAPPAERWEKFATDWTAFADQGKRILGGAQVPGGNPVVGLLTMAAATLGWDVPRPSSALNDGGDRPWLLNGALPQLLVDNLSTEYPELPRYNS